MSDTNGDTTAATPKPEPLFTPPRGYKVVHVKEYTHPITKKKVPAHDRVMKIRTPRGKPGEYDKVAHRRVKPGPKQGKPRFTTALHAEHLYEQLAVPLAFLYGMRFNDDATSPSAMMLYRCRTAIEEAMTFLDRFTTRNGDINDTDAS